MFSRSEHKSPFNTATIQRHSLLEFACRADVGDGSRREIAARRRRRARALGFVELAANLGATFFRRDELVSAANARARATVGRELAACCNALRFRVAVNASVWTNVDALAVGANHLRLNARENHNIAITQTENHYIHNLHTNIHNIHTQRTQRTGFSQRVTVHIVGGFGSVHLHGRSN